MFFQHMTTISLVRKRILVLLSTTQPGKKAISKYTFPTLISANLWRCSLAVFVSVLTCGDAYWPCMPCSSFMTVSSFFFLPNGLRTSFKWIFLSQKANLQLYSENPEIFPACYICNNEAHKDCELSQKPPLECGERRGEDKFGWRYKGDKKPL